MAVDTTEKALGIAQQVASDSSRFMDALRHMVMLTKQADAAGINFAGMDFENTNLKHTTGDQIANTMTTAIAVLSWLETNFHDDAFERVRT